MELDHRLNLRSLLFYA